MQKRDLLSNTRHLIQAAIGGVADRLAVVSADNYIIVVSRAVF